MLLNKVIKQQIKLAFIYKKRLLICMALLVLATLTNINNLKLATRATPALILSNFFQPYVIAMVLIPILLVFIVSIFRIRLIDMSITRTRSVLLEQLLVSITLGSAILISFWSVLSIIIFSLVGYWSLVIVVLPEIITASIYLIIDIIILGTVAAIVFIITNSPKKAFIASFIVNLFALLLNYSNAPNLIYDFTRLTVNVYVIGKFGLLIAVEIILSILLMIVIARKDF